MPVSQGHIELEEKHFRDGISAEEMSVFAGYPVFKHDLGKMPFAQDVIDGVPLYASEIEQRAEVMTQKVLAVTTRLCQSDKKAERDREKQELKEELEGIAECRSANLKFFGTNAREETKSGRRPVKAKVAVGARYRSHPFAVGGRSLFFHPRLAGRELFVKEESHYFSFFSEKDAGTMIEMFLDAPLKTTAAPFSFGALLLQEHLHEMRHMVQARYDHSENVYPFTAEVDADKYFYDVFAKSGLGAEAKRLLLTLRYATFLSSENSHAIAPALETAIAGRKWPELDRIWNSQKTLCDLWVKDQPCFDGRDEQSPYFGLGNPTIVSTVLWEDPARVFLHMAQVLASGAMAEVDPLARQSAHKFVKAGEVINPDWVRRPLVRVRAAASLEP